MRDLIERQMAIALVVNDMNHRVDISEDAKEYLFGLRTRLWQLPSADITDRPKGKWHHIQSVCYGGGTMNEVVCSKCHEHQILPTNFCPNCGADMRQTENEDEKL